MRPESNIDSLYIQELEGSHNRNRFSLKPVFNPVVYSNRKNSFDINYSNFMNDNSIYVCNNNLRRNSFFVEEKDFLEIFQSSFKFLNDYERENINDDVKSIFLLEESSNSNRRSSFEQTNDIGVVEQFMD